MKRKTEKPIQPQRKTRHDIREQLLREHRDRRFEEMLKQAEEAAQERNGGAENVR